ncbi:MAG TPA: Holliday junction resolvase-like protein [archaeon]|nr:Holliday junction resolvase-like protein [archaeon]
MALELLLAALAAVFLLIALFLGSRLFALRRQLAELAFAKSSQSVRYGKLSEQFMPFLKDYPYDPQQFRFLGTPVDGVQFNEDEIVFLEFKAANGRASEKQRSIRGLVEKKAVRFEERRIS